MTVHTHNGFDCWWSADEGRYVAFRCDVSGEVTFTARTWGGLVDRVYLWLYERGVVLSPPRPEPRP